MRVDGGSTPTNGLRICIGAFVFACASRRADRVVRPYGCIPFRIGAFQICDGVPRGRGRTPPLRKFDALVQTHPRPAPREIPRRGRSPFLVGQRIAKGRSKLPLAVFLYTASGAFFPHGKKGGLSPHRCTAPCKSAKRGDTIQTRNRRAGQAPPLRYDETRYSSKTTASDPVSQLR